MMAFLLVHFEKRVRQDLQIEGGTLKACSRLLFFKIYYLKRLSSSEEKAFHILSATVCKAASLRSAVPSSCIQECKQCKKPSSFN